MNHSCMGRRIAAQCHIAGLPAKGAIHARDSDGKEYYGKTGDCRKRPGERNLTWLANELIYYCIADLSGLKMPHSCILDVGGRLVWGSEYQVGREAIRKSEVEGGLELSKACNSSSTEVLSLARALLLDLALLNSDRKPWNILVSGPGERKELWFFDHEKSLLGDGREDGDLWRIRVKYDPEQKIGDYFMCPAANQLVFHRLSDSEIRAIFDSLALNPESLRTARASCPDDWVSTSLFRDLEHFLLTWWGLLGKRLHDQADYLRQKLTQCRKLDVNLV